MTNLDENQQISFGDILDCLRSKKRTILFLTMIGALLPLPSPYFKTLFFSPTLHLRRKIRLLMGIQQRAPIFQN